MTDLPQLRRDLYAKARKADVSPDTRIILERMITQIDSRRSEHPFVDQLAHSHRLLEHRMAGGEWPDLSAEEISKALGLQDNDDRGGFEALSEDGRLLELYPSAIVTAEVNGGSRDQ